MSQPKSQVLSQFSARKTGWAMLLVRLALALGLFTATTASAATALYSAFAAPVSHSSVNDGVFLAEADSAGEMAARKQVNDAANNGLDEPVTPFIPAGAAISIHGPAAKAGLMPADTAASPQVSAWASGARAPPQASL